MVVLRRAVFLLAVLFGLAGSAPLRAESRSIDPERSTLEIFVYKSGLFSAFADNHVIRAPIDEGRITDEGERAVELTVKSARVIVLDPNMSADTRADVQARMLGPEVLDSSRYPTIRFVSHRVVADGPNQWRVSGELTLHGGSRVVSCVVALRDGHYRGSTTIRQRNFGIQPISIIGGTVKVKDELRIDFDIVTIGARP